MDPRRLLARLLLPRLVAGALSPGWARLVMGWVRGSPSLLAQYEALRAAERVAVGDRQALSAAQRAVLLALIVPEPVEPPRAFAPALSGALAATSLALFFLVKPPADGDLAARTARLAEEPLGVKVSCVDAQEGRVLAIATGGARQTGARLACPKGSLLGFTTTNLASDVRHLFVVGIAPGGALRWYAPFSRDAHAHRLAPGHAGEVLRTLADTRPMPDDASVSLFVLVSDRPFDGRVVEEKLERSIARGLLLDRLDRLPIDVPWQARIDMQMAP